MGDHDELTDTMLHAMEEALGEHLDDGEAFERAYDWVTFQIEKREAADG